ncbi:primase-like DNA-binding domain-containing protein [Ammoniphilus sp. 3BR4]|uniref:primase-like DNA-binding domain-containing protein n=1 Tax=Ammoniphilus sp. 3BR4 TaxID=3158265 RepID=UPI00346663E3
MIELCGTGIHIDYFLYLFFNYYLNLQLILYSATKVPSTFYFHQYSTWLEKEDHSALPSNSSSQTKQDLPMNGRSCLVSCSGQSIDSAYRSPKLLSARVRTPLGRKVRSG